MISFSVSRLVQNGQSALSPASNQFAPIMEWSPDLAKGTAPDQSMGDCQIALLNAQVGWLLVGKGTATGSEAVDVLHTSDGGANWKVISVSNYKTVNNSAAIPFGGDKSGLSFVNATTGWVTGFTPVDHFAWLYVTHDGGVTWQHQPIPLPGDAFQVSTLPPIFFNATDGILPVVLPGPHGQALNIYVTHNKGMSSTLYNAPQ
jgi:photosystem II stability/assembly factor-like uncharacterized protein